MKTNRKPEDLLLDDVLRSEWQATSEAIKSEAMGAFQAHQRRRRVLRMASSAVVVGLAMLCLSHWVTAPETPSQSVVKHTDISEAQPLYMTDEELLAVFPEGSCVLAEVDGKKELLFLDPKVEEAYMAKR